MRLFLGLFPDDETLVKIRDSIRQLDKIKRNFNFLPYEQMHMTVKFLGANVSDGSAQYITEKLTEITPNIKTTEIKLNKLMYGFKGQKKPNVMFFQIKENEAIDNLVSKVHKHVKGMKLADVIRQKDRKKFLHHVTIARVKRSVSNSLVRQTREAIDKVNIPEEISFTPKEMYLVQSILTPTGPEYKKMAKFKLAPASKVKTN